MDRHEPVIVQCTVYRLCSLSPTNTDNKTDKYRLITADKISTYTIYRQCICRSIDRQSSASQLSNSAPVGLPGCRYCIHLYFAVLVATEEQYAYLGECKEHIN